MRKQTKLAVVVSAAALLALGASMTSFAAGWEQQDGEWVYLDKYGDRVYNEWKKSNGNYYYLNDDGVMATDVVVEHEDNKYYVDETGKKVVNQWVSVDNEDDITVGGNEVDTLWYYFDGNGKALKAAAGKTVRVKEVAYAGGKAKFMFDADGYMMSGWQRDDSDNLYYLGDENEGWAYTGWQYLEPEAGGPDAYEDNVWYYFKSGKAYKATDADYVTKYIDGKYYTFDEFGVMQDDWYAATAPAASGAKAWASSQGALGLGWVETSDPSDSDTYWYYLINVRDDDGVARSIPFNYEGNEYAAKVIKSKTYLFNDEGEMQTGIVDLTDGGVAEVEGGKALAAGIYYFNEDEDSTEGQMATGRVTVEEDGEYYYYHFAKDGTAYRNTIKDGVLYDENGVRVQAEDGNTYSIETVSGVTVQGKEGVVLNGTIAVNASGRVKSSGSIKIDGQVWEITDYIAAKAAN